MLSVVQGICSVLWAKFLPTPDVGGAERHPSSRISKDKRDFRPTSFSSEGEAASITNDSWALFLFTIVVFGTRESKREEVWFPFWLESSENIPLMLSSGKP